MQASDPPDTGVLPASLPHIGPARIALGLLQGVLLYLLYRAETSRAWPATEPLLFVPLVMIALFVPVLVVSGLGHVERRRLLLWAGAAALLLAALGAYDAWRSADLPLAPVYPSGNDYAQPGQHRATLPAWHLILFTAAGLFIAQSLLLAGIRDRRRIATYATHFDIAWKLGVQLAFSGLFVGVTWLVLHLGASLFELVKLAFLTELLRKAWFWIPVTAFAFACAMHLTDVRPAIVRGIRGLLLVLMSWLLPVAVLLVGGFLLTLPFTGLAPLWGTRRAAAVLLSAAALFVILVNAAWQQGGDGRDVARVLRLAARIAVLLLAPLVLIAMFALYLRVRGYGWTGDRVDAAACMLVAACYAAGYFHAGLRPGWLPSLSRVNIGTAFVALAVLLAMFSPLLDPARLSVNSQVARLVAGKVKANAFDFAFLRFDGERFGRAALAQLERGAGGPDAALVRRQVAVVRKMKNRWDGDSRAPLENLAANLRLHPADGRLPDSFLRTGWGTRDDRNIYPNCLLKSGRHCDVILLDVTGDGKPEMLLFPVKETGSKLREDNMVFAEDAAGRWSAYAAFSPPRGDCKTYRDGLAAGKVEAVPAQMSDIDIGGMRVRLAPISQVPACPDKLPAPDKETAHDH